MLGLLAINIEILLYLHKCQHENCRCALKFCQFDKISIRTCVFSYSQLHPFTEVPYFRTYMGNVPSLIIADAEMLKQILVKEFSKFTDRVVSSFIQIREALVAKCVKRWPAFRFDSRSLKPFPLETRFHRTQPFIITLLYPEMTEALLNRTKISSHPVIHLNALPTGIKAAIFHDIKWNNIIQKQSKFQDFSFVIYRNKTRSDIRLFRCLEKII